MYCTQNARRGGVHLVLGLPPFPMLEVLPKPTLTLFVKKPFQFWREKNFPEIKSANVCFRPKADVHDFLLVWLFIFLGNMNNMRVQPL